MKRCHCARCQCVTQFGSFQSQSVETTTDTTPMQRKQHIPCILSSIIFHLPSSVFRLPDNISYCPHPPLAFPRHHYHIAPPQLHPHPLYIPPLPTFMRAPRVTPSRARFALNLSLGLNILVLLCLLLQADPLLIARHLPERLAKYDLAAPGLFPRADQVGWRVGEQGSILAEGSCDMCTTSPGLCEVVG